MPTMFEIAMANREEDWRKAGVSEADVQLALKSGIDGRDVRAFRDFTSKGYLIVVRCPKRTAALWHGIFPAKTWATKAKTNDAGVVSSARGIIMVSDYDLMSAWRRGGDGWEKIFMSAAGGASRGRWSAEATALARGLNRILVSRIQHGCQDDFQSAKNPGVKPGDHFMGFAQGSAEYLPDAGACAAYYARHHLEWPYDHSGKYRGVL